jgi:hypothetical protein
MQRRSVQREKKAAANLRLCQTDEQQIYLLLCLSL